MGRLKEQVVLLGVKRSTKIENESGNWRAVGHAEVSMM